MLQKAEKLKLAHLAVTLKILPWIDIDQRHKKDRLSVQMGSFRQMKGMEWIEKLKMVKR